MLSSEEGCGLLFVFALALVFGVIGLGWKAVSCSHRWSDFETDWGPAAGCRVMIDGKWIPEDRVREFGR